MDVSIIVPAYNEEKYIQPLLKTLKEIQGEAEVLVVNDGSIDSTGHIVESMGIDLINLEYNKGKSLAMLDGLNNTSGEIVVFLDADLIGLTKAQLQSLYQPIICGNADMTIGVFKSGRSLTDLAQRLTPYLSGQRAIKREFLQRLDRDKWLVGYGIEVTLTRLAKRHNLRVASIPLSNVTHPMKEEKLGIVRGFTARMKMYWEITKELSRI